MILFVNTYIVSQFKYKSVGKSNKHTQINIVNKPLNTRVKTKKIFCNGLIYVNEKNWCVWINNKKITPNNLPNNVQILDVNNQNITIKSADISDSITIKPNQYYDCSLCKIFSTSAIK